MNTFLPPGIDLDRRVTVEVLEATPQKIRSCEREDGANDGPSRILETVKIGDDHFELNGTRVSFCPSNDPKHAKIVAEKLKKLRHFSHYEVADNSATFWFCDSNGWRSRIFPGENEAHAICLGALQLTEEAKRNCSLV